jgi:peptidoglycan/xylan/chitin deacetylase (PgdA/CDA1 family)
MVLIAGTASVLALAFTGGCSRTGGFDQSTTTESTEMATTSTSPAAPEPPPSTAAPTTTTTTVVIPQWPKGPSSPIGPINGMAPVIDRVDTNDPVIFLTIDDGMVRDPRVPEFLIANGIPATLFVNEGPVRADPFYFAQVASAGGSINSHTRSHPDLRKVSSDVQRREICGMFDVITDSGLERGHLFRSPYGVQNATTQRVAAECGAMAILRWNVALNDGMVQFQRGGNLRPGDIVLSHFRADLYDNLVELVRKANEDGLVIAPLDAYIPAPSR